uniref:Uncharacterized protein n=1 Tax=Rhizophora mucronata TaxID=61149 RepID=A0A2P2NTD0_RHIMU
MRQFPKVNLRSFLYLLIEMKIPSRVTFPRCHGLLFPSRIPRPLVASRSCFK